MHIRSIHIENIRGFESLDLDLDRGDGTFAGWTVLAGVNGSGKSTLLKAIALACSGPRRAPSLLKSFAGWIREGASLAKCRVDLVPGPLDDYQPPAKGYLTTPIRESVGLRWERKNGGPEPYVGADGESLTNMTGPWAGDRTGHGPWDPNPGGWFLAGYGPFRRLGERDDREHGSQTLSALATLFNEDATLGEAIQWLKHEVYAARLDRLERARKQKERGLDVEAESLEIEAASLGKLHFAVCSLLNDGLLPDGAKVIDFDMEGLWIEQAGRTLPLRQLSDGYRAAAALVFDILRLLHTCYRGMDVDATIGKSPIVVPYDGVVLIDEVDAHLHPEWQKRIGFWLKTHFPNIQFIVTTHSPFICQAADARGLIRLPPPGSDQRAEHVSDEDFRRIVNGGADDAVMSRLFGLEQAHSRASEEKRSRAATIEAKIVRGAATDSEIQELESLLSTLPDTGSAAVERVLRKHEALR